MAYGYVNIFTFQHMSSNVLVDGGSDYGAATAGTDNAKTFYHQGVCGMLDWGVDVFYFEAFDEPWKPASVGDNGHSEDETHWGAYTADRTAKFDLSC
jgi:glucan 1,3-beta-glucosidase